MESFARQLLVELMPKIKNLEYYYFGVNKDYYQELFPNINYLYLELIFNNDASNDNMDSPVAVSVAVAAAGGRPPVQAWDAVSAMQRRQVIDARQPCRWTLTAADRPCIPGPVPAPQGVTTTSPFISGCGPQV